MGNLITAHKLGDDAYFRTSNGGMAALMDVLLLACSDLAKSPWETDLARFLAELDQDVFGSGTVGFDLADLGWTRHGFAEQKRFVLEMIDLARARHRWEALGYEPTFAPVHLDELRALVERWSVEHVEDKAWELRAPTQKPELCAGCRVYVHAHGCPVCHESR